MLQKKERIKIMKPTYNLLDGKVMDPLRNDYTEESRLMGSNTTKMATRQAGKMSFDYMTSFVNGKNVKRLKSVYDSNEHVASYSYTLEGHRTGKYLHDGEEEISYHYNGRNVQYEQWSSGRTVRYTHPIEGGSSCSSCGCGGSSGVFTDHPISIKVNGTKYYYLYNGQGSVTELINADEEVVNKYRYTPFGSPRLKIETVYNPYQYTGRRLDEETGQYYYRARMYSAEQCRFTTQDPAGMQEGPNMYAYVGNNPVNHRDPSGLMVSAGSGGGSSIDFEKCPGDFRFDTFWECFDEYESRGFHSPGDVCITYCYDVPSFDYGAFWSCLFPFRASWNSAMMWASHAGCASAIVGGIASAMGTGGLSTSVAISLIEAGCAASEIAIAMCLDQAT